MKGTRVQAIIRELRGEKIDIVEWSEDPVLFVTNALSPAKVQRVSIVDDHERVMEVVVEDKQLSLAIGKKGQNVRLAAKLTGWRIDIKSEEEKRREVELQFAGLELGGDSEDAAAEAEGELSTDAQSEPTQEAAGEIGPGEQEPVASDAGEEALVAVAGDTADATDEALAVETAAAGEPDRARTDTQ
jgi:N utilization substance protein A